MRKYYKKAISLALTRTAKDTYILFTGNILSAFLGFLFTLLVARGLSVSDFGVFSAANNLMVIIASVSDLGISSGLIRFSSKLFDREDKTKAHEYVKASYFLRFATVFVISMVMVIFSSFISPKLLATSDRSISVWVGVLSLGVFSWYYFQHVLQAQKRFIAASFLDVSFMVVRLSATYGLLVLGYLTLSTTMGAFTAAGLSGTVVGLVLVGIGFYKAKPSKKIYSNLIRFSGWLGVNRVVSALSGRLDVTMLAAMTGATLTGYYSISSRLALFIVVLAGSFGKVLAPRFSSFDSKDAARKYILKSLLFLIPVIAGIIVWILIAHPFITILFGSKYAPAVPVFQALAASMIPFLLTVPSVTAIIYELKKPIYIGTFSFFQLILIFFLNLLFIPKYQTIGPTITFAIVHSILAIYTWGIVYRHYFK